MSRDMGRRLEGINWRRGRDSNPRYGYPYAAFRVRCFQPLSHLSKPLREELFALWRDKCPFATALLPNLISGACLEPPAGLRQRSRPRPPACPQHVAVNIESDGDRRMTKALLHHLGMNLGFSASRWRACVADRADAGGQFVLGQEQLEGMCQRARLIWAAVGLGDYEVVIR